MPLSDIWLRIPRIAARRNIFVPTFTLADCIRAKPGGGYGETLADQPPIAE